MISLKDSVFSPPKFDKVAEYELPKEVSGWNEEILKQFYADVNYLPKDLNVDIAVNNVDDNKGYAKGSVVVFTGENKINFPIIVKDFKLSPFDTFVDRENGKNVYRAASLRNIKKALATEKHGKLENIWGKGDLAAGVKSTAGIYPKKAISIDDPQIEALYPPFSKMSGWPFLAKGEDLDKLAVQLAAQEDVASSFVDNTGDLISNIIDVKNNDNYQQPISDDHKEGDLDLKNVVKAKQVITAIDSELLDPNDLIPIKPPSVCELRLNVFPSMEDFIERGNDMRERFMATRIGQPVSGVVLDLKSEEDYAIPMPSSSHESEEKKVRNRRPQIFISSCGCYYAICSDWDKTGISFYGTKTLDTEGALEKVIGMISENTSDDFINQNRGNRRDGSDKLFAPNQDMNEGKDDLPYSREYYGPHSTNLMIVYGAGNAYECTRLYGNFKKYKVNDSNVYVSESCAVIPANIASVQKVSSVEDPMYKMVVGKAKKIYLIPEGSVIINTEYMKNIEKDEFISPDNSVKQAYEESAISKVAVYVAPKGDSLGYRITGKPFESLEKIAAVNGPMNTQETLGALKIMGVSPAKSQEILKIAVNRFGDRSATDKSVIVYGVNDDYINGNIFQEREKQARVREIIKEYSYSLRKDLVKEASVLGDPEAVDVVLSLNFINEDSIAGYIENIEEMKRISGDLSQMLIASRMGLSDLDESALKKSIHGLNEVIEGLENLKMATEKSDD